MGIRLFLEKILRGCVFIEVGFMEFHGFNRILDNADVYVLNPIKSVKSLKFYFKKQKILRGSNPASSAAISNKSNSAKPIPMDQNDNISTKLG